MATRRVIVTGGSGQLGQAIIGLQRRDWQITALGSADLDICDWAAVRNHFSVHKPDLVIHAAAATNVDRCEREPEWAYQTNAVGSRHIAQAATMLNAELVYVSTNYVFNGDADQPYHEFDAPSPISVYGASKFAGELEARRSTERCHIVRTASVYSETGHNFVRTMRGLMERLDRLTVVHDQKSNPTYAHDLATAISQLVDEAPFGTYHVTNAGVASWYEWAVEIARLTGATAEIVPIPAAEFQRDATPPANGSLQSLALPGLGITVPNWKDALERCLAQWPE